jgi:uncharacterized protein YndB with AHSA1/START domain
METPAMATYRLTVDTTAPPEVTFDLWTNLDRMREWVGGVTKVTDVTGPTDVVGTRYVVWFGRMKSPTEVVAVERPRHFRSKFGNRLLRGENDTTFEAIDGGTRISQEFRTVGVIPAISAWIFSRGSYRGSFEGELREFAKLAEREAARSAATDEVPG